MASWYSILMCCYIWYQKCSWNNFAFDHCREHVLSSWSINTSGIMGTSEGADFKHEVINKTLQHWVPANPSGDDWNRASCNHDQLKTLREEVFAQACLKDPKNNATSRQAINLENELLAFRGLIRENQFLSNPTAPLPLKSITGVLLEQDAVNILSLCRSKRAKYCEIYRKYEPIRSNTRATVPFNEPPIFITEEERLDFQRIDKKRSKELKLEIPEKIAAVTIEKVRDALKEAWDEVLKKQPLKADLVAFYYVVKEKYEDALCTEACEELDADTSEI